MTSRNYDYKLQVNSTTGFNTYSVITGTTSNAVAVIAGIDTSNNILKVRMANAITEFSNTEVIISNSITTSGTANGTLDTTSLPFQANTYASESILASANIQGISPSTFIAEKNAFIQQPIVRLYSLYYPGEWYPSNEAGNPTGKGAGRAWPNDFPIRIAEVVGDIASDVNYNVTFDSESFIPFPVNISGLEQASDGKINDLSVSIFNVDNILSVLVEDPYLSGNCTSNAVQAYVNGELVHGIDPRTVNAIPSDFGTVGTEGYDVLTRARANGLAYDTSIVSAYGRENASFTHSQALSINGTWEAHKPDTRDLLGGVLEVKTTFANFLDYWPEYSTITSSDSVNNTITVYNSLAYRVGDMVYTDGYKEANVTSIDTTTSTLYLDNTPAIYLSIADRVASPEGIVFNTSGEIMLVVDRSYNKITKYNLQTANNIASAMYTSNLDISSETTLGRGIDARNDGLVVIVAAADSANVFSYSLTESWDLSTASLDTNLYVGTKTPSPTGVAINSAGTQMFLTDSSTSNVTSYTLSTAWDISTASFTSEFSVATKDSAPNDISFSVDGYKMYILGNATDSIYEYTLTIAWDLSTASFSSEYFVGTQDPTPAGLSILNDGSSIFISGDSTSTVYEYTMSTPFDLSTASQTVASVGDPLYIANLDADKDGYVIDTFKIDQLEGLNEYVANFSLTSWLQNFRLSTPKRKFYKNTCQWKYKGPECQYPGPGGLPIPGTNLTSNTNPLAADNTIAANAAGDICPKSLLGCKLRNNGIHFGGFPGVGRTIPRA